MRIVLASDHAGFSAKEAMIAYLATFEGLSEITDLGTKEDISVDYPDFGRKAAEAVISGAADFGIVICGTGIGISIAANRISGARCALCHDVTTARLAREHNDANLLAMGARITGLAVMQDILDVFLSTPFTGGRHQHRIDNLG